MAEKRRKDFEEAKRLCLSRADLSRKGSIDEPIRPLVNLFNQSDHFYTTSTCSGRISLVVKPQDNAAIKKGGDFLMNSHESISFEHFKLAIDGFITEEKSLQTCLWLKFEPFIMHIQCIDLEKANSLLQIAIASGCRNSGLTIGKKKKYLVAIRSTSSMEVPLACEGSFKNLRDDYLEFLCMQCCRRMEDNFSRMSKFQTMVEPLLT